MAIARVNTVGTYDAAAQNNIASPSFAATAGNLIVVVQRSPAPVFTISDTAGNLYYKLRTITASATDLEMWACWNCLAHATNVVTIAYASTPVARGIAVVQYSGISATPLDLTAIKIGVSAGSTITSNTFTTAEADCVIVTFAQVNATGQTWTPNGSATKFISADTSDVIMGMEKIVSSIQTGTTASTDCTSTTNLLLIAAVFAAGGGGAVASGGSFAFVG